jgi:hypothetical protein
MRSTSSLNGFSDGIPGSNRHDAIACSKSRAVRERVVSVERRSARGMQVVTPRDLNAIKLPQPSVTFTTSDGSARVSPSMFTCSPPPALICAENIALLPSIRSRFRLPAMRSTSRHFAKRAIHCLSPRSESWLAHWPSSLTRRMIPTTYQRSVSRRTLSWRR